MADRLESIQQQITNIEESLRLIEVRKSEYVQPVDIPLQLIREEQRLKARKEALQAELDGLRGGMAPVETESSALPDAEVVAEPGGLPPGSRVGFERNRVSRGSALDHL